MRLGRPLFGDRKIRQHGDPSGLAVAERAHQRGKAKLAEPRGIFDVTVSLAIVGDREQAERLAEAMAADACERAGVGIVACAVSER